MTTMIGGMVLRCKNYSVTERYYRALGLRTNEHKHGSGPLHFGVTPLTEDFVVELYNASEKYPTDAIMLCVTSLEESSKLSVAFLGTAIGEIIKHPDCRIAHMKDPDGRNVMLIECL